MLAGGFSPMQDLMSSQPAQSPFVRKQTNMSTLERNMTNRGGNNGSVGGGNFSVSNRNTRNTLHSGVGINPIIITAQGNQPNQAKDLNTSLDNYISWHMKLEEEAQKKLRDRERRKSMRYMQLQEDHDQILWSNSFHNGDNENKGFNSDEDYPDYQNDGNQANLYKNKTSQVSSFDPNYQKSVKVSNKDFKLFIGQSLFRSKFQIFWALFIILCVSYNYFTFFYYLAIEGFPEDAWLFIEIMVEAIMIIDFCLNIFLMQINKRTWNKMYLIRNHNDESFLKIGLNLIAVIPTSFIIASVYYKGGRQFNHQSFQISFVRIHKMLKLPTIINYFNNFTEIEKRKYKSQTIHMIKVIYFLLITSHLMTCIWLILNRIETNDQTWFKRAELQYAQPFEIYLEACVFVLTMMMGCGFVNYIPQNKNEEQLSMVIVVIGASIYAAFFSFFVVIIHHRNAIIIENDTKLEQAMNFSSQLGLKQSTKNKIYYFYTSIRLKYGELETNYKMIQELPLVLRQNVSLKIYANFNKKVKIFEHAEEAFIRDMCTCFRPMICLQKDLVIQQYEIAVKMFFIAKGLTEVLATDNRTVLTELEVGFFFGEIGLLITGTRTCSIRAKTSCMFYTIEKEQLLEVLAKHPDQNRILFAIASQRYKITKPEDLPNYQQDILPDRGPLDRSRADQMSQSLYTQAAEVEEETLTENQILTERVKNLSYKIYLPFTQFYKIWITILIIIYTYNLILVPFQIAFDYEIPVKFIIFDIITILINVYDIKVRARTAIDKNGNRNLKQNEVISDYINSGSFLFDLVSVIPLDYAFRVSGFPLHYASVARLLRLLKLPRIVQLIGLIRKITSVKLSSYSLMICFPVFCLVCHILACIFFLVGKYEYRVKNRFNKKNLFDDMIDRDFIEFPLILYMPTGQQYLHMLYFGIQYTGAFIFGDMIPYGHLEEALIIIFLLFQKFFTSFILAEAENYSSSTHASYTEHVHKLGDIVSWMKTHSMPKELINRVMEYEDLLWKTFKGNDVDSILMHLPETLNQEIQYQLFKELVDSVSIFPKDDIGALSSLVKRLKLVLYPKGEYVIKSGEIATDMYFIVNGMVHIYVSTNIKVAELGQGKYFGEIALVQGKASLRNASALCHVHSSIAVLTQHDFDLIRKKYPQFNHKIQEEVEKRQLELNKKKEEDRLKEEEKKMKQEVTKGSSNDAYTKSLSFISQHAHSEIQAEPKLKKSKSEISKTLDYYYDCGQFLQKLYNKKRIFVALLGLLQIYNYYVYPLMIAFKWNINQSPFLLAMEIITIIIYVIHLIIQLLKLRKMNELFKVMCLNEQQRQAMFGSNNQNNIKYGNGVFSLNSADALKAKAKLLQKDLLDLKFQIFCLSLSIIPVALIADAFPHSHSNVTVSILKMLRLLTYQPFLKLFSYFRKRFMYAARILENVLLYYAVVHFLASLFIHVTTYHEHYDPQHTWLKRLPVPQSAAAHRLLAGGTTSAAADAATVDTTTDSNSTHADQHLSEYTIYISALEFHIAALSHMCKADISAVNIEERGFMIMSMLIYYFLFAFVFGSIVSMITEMMPKHFIYLNERFHYVMSKIRTDKLSRCSIENVKEYYDYLWNSSKGISEEFLKEFPGNIRADILYFKYQDAFLQSNLFYSKDGKVEQCLIKSLITLLEFRVYQKNDFITMLGTYDPNTYFLLDGTLYVYGANDEYLGYLRRGAHISNACNSSSYDFEQKRLANIFTTKFCIIGVLSPENLFKMSKAFPEWYAYFAQYNRIFMKTQAGQLDNLLVSRCLEINIANQLTVLEQSAVNAKHEDFMSLIDDLVAKGNSVHYQNNYDLLTRISTKYHAKFQDQKRYSIMVEQLEDGKFTQEDSSKKFTSIADQYNVQKVVKFLEGLNILYIAIFQPIQIGFMLELTDVLLAAEILSLIFSVALIIINCKNPIEQNGRMISNLRPVLKNYYHNKGLVYDIFAALPLNLILGLTLPMSTNIVVNLIRLTRVINIGKIFNYYQRLEIRFRKHNYAIRVSQPIIFFVLFWIWCSCLWFYIVIVYERDKEDTWLNAHHLLEQQFSVRFSYSMYLMIDSRDVMPYNDLEMTVMIILINLGDVLFSVFFGLLAGLTMQSQHESDAEQIYNKMDHILHYLKDYHIDDDIRAKIKNYFSYSWSLQTTSGMIKLQELNDYLPYKLSKDIIYYSARDLLLPMFGKFNSENFIKDICLHLEHVIYLPDSFIIIKDENGEEMYFIAEGSVNVLSADKMTVLKTLYKGSFFGEIAIFLDTKRTTFVKSDSYCSIYVLKKMHIDNILKSYSSIQEQFKKEAEVRVQQIRKFMDVKMKTRNSMEPPLHLEESKAAHLTLRTEQSMLSQQSIKSLGQSVSQTSSSGGHDGISGSGTNRQLKEFSSMSHSETSSESSDSNIDRLDSGPIRFLHPNSAIRNVPSNMKFRSSKTDGNLTLNLITKRKPSRLQNQSTVGEKKINQLLE